MKNKCTNCGLVNFPDASNCKRCNAVLTATLSETTRPAVQGISSDLAEPTVSTGMNFLFNAIYVLATFVGLFGFGMGMAFGGKTENIFIMIAIGLFIFTLPLFGAYFLVENWRASILNANQPDAAPKSEELSISYAISAGAGLVAAIVAAAVSGWVINAFLPGGRYPIFLLAFPAIFAGVITMAVVRGITTGMDKQP